ncbi:MAG: glycoside hydrolase family 88 protein [Christensenellaceae bacterium]|nr:glycoside hydrolase family 88 protein [Christensenellaceae bacterium]
MLNRYEEAARKAIDKFRRSAAMAAEMGLIPYKSEGGRWVPSPCDGNGWWTGGFWPGLMWQLWAMTKDDAFLREARRTEALLTEELRVFRRLNHDVGFMYLLSCGADWKLTGDEQARMDALHAASLLMGRFNPAGFIRAWNGDDQQGLAIIDCMMNLSLLYWATKQTGDPRFARVADIHAATAMREFLRENGSVSHIIEFDPVTGARVRELGGQGYALGTSWSRGQAWGLYGFTLAALNTGSPDCLAAAERIAAYFIANIRPDGLTDCDFCQPRDEERLDNIAGAVAACGLIELGGLTGRERYRAAALRLIDGLLDRCADWTEASCGVLTRCTASYHDDGAGRHTNITYGDYFLVEALAKLCGTDPMLWTA